MKSRNMLMKPGQPRALVRIINSFMFSTFKLRFVIKNRSGTKITCVNSLVRGIVLPAILAYIVRGVKTSLGELISDEELSTRVGNIQNRKCKNLTGSCPFEWTL
ncbi:uncharacterized protein ZBAI_03563 [Zygosaccharomyces bailii ISA1307]|nr:uncharacterized protein ZBAI_03563 [Zygosaccharomyces bailii ISA1307]